MAVVVVAVCMAAKREGSAQPTHKTITTTGASSANRANVGQT
jgi:hypothetical protein